MKDWIYNGQVNNGDLVILRKYEDDDITTSSQHIAVDCDENTFSWEGSNESFHQQGHWYWVLNDPKRSSHTPSRDWKENAAAAVDAVVRIDEAFQEHPSGALRESKEGKGLPHLILCGYPRALKALSKHMDCELGRERNWEKGLPESSLISSGFRHLLGYTSGASEDTEEYNLAALLWNVMCLVETYHRVQDGEMPEELLDIRKEGE